MKRAVYPGSFDPVTNGHLDIIERAAVLFDEVIVAVARNRAKHALFSVAERLEMLREVTGSLVNVKVDAFDGLTVRYAKAQGAQVIIRGLRVLSDFENEMMMALMNRNQEPTIDTIFLMTSKDHAFLSSSAVKELASLGGDISALVPPEVARQLAARVQGGGLSRWP
ncbi:MAG: pantetheine-phosphate adenylyltransferase [Bacillota bacterium]|nr:pantetheine-phosphate adenylyltransferase [Bacillota bacterium]